MNQKLLTIFTPTFNRAEKLKDCFQSLIAQTSHDFCWQIIDDGSTDQTESLISEWKESAFFEIYYYKVKNGGKCRAINKSLSISDTKLWMCLDSDDVLVENAVELIKDEYKKIENSEGICGFFSLRGKNEKESMQGRAIPSDLTECKQRYIRYQLGIMPEYAHVFKTEIVKDFIYPSIPGENYFPLSYVYDQIDELFNYKVLHVPIMICEYRKDGLTKNKRNVIMKNPIGYSIYKKQLVSFAPTTKEKYKAVATYITGCLLSKKNPFKDNDFKGLTLLLYPVGFLDYFIRYKLSMNFDFEIKTKKI